MAHRAVRDNFKGRFDGVGENLGLKICKLNEEVDIPADREHTNKENALNQMAKFRLVKESAASYRLAFERFQRAVDAHGDCEIFEIKTSTRVLLGTGNASVFEFGFNLNYPWGVPYITGSTLKGAVSAYLAKRGGEDWKRYEGAEKSIAQVDLFGGSLKGDSKSYSGLVVFHDAWMCPWEARRDRGDWFDMDIITPHYTSYYRGEGAPTGMDDPLPIKIAALCPGLRFQVVLQGPEKHRKFVRTWLREALEVDGIGGKTAAGYGRFEYVLNVEEVRAEIQAAESDAKLMDFYKVYGDNSIYFSTFAEKLDTEMSSEMEDMWKVLRPLEYLGSLIGSGKGNISKLKDLNKRYKGMEPSITHWKECMGVVELKKTPAGQALFERMCKNWADDVESGKNLKIVSELKPEWDDFLYSADEMLEMMEADEDSRPSNNDLRSYIENNFSGDDLELLVSYLDDLGV